MSLFNKSFLRKFTGVLILFLFLFSLIPANILAVDDERSIQDLVDGAVDNGTIILPDGEYHGNVVVKKSLTIRAMHPGKVTLNVNGDVAGFSITGDNVHLDGLNVVGDGVNTLGFDITGDNNVISNCSVSNHGKSGIVIMGSNNTVEDSNIFDNHGSNGAGILISTKSAGGVIRDNNIINCAIYNNIATFRGGGIYITGVSNRYVYNTLITKSDIVNNTAANTVASFGGGIGAEYANGINVSSSNIVNNNIDSNTDSNNNGCGIFLFHYVLNSSFNYNRIFARTRQDDVRIGYVESANNDFNFNWWGDNQVNNRLNNVLTRNHYIIKNSFDSSSVNHQFILNTSEDDDKTLLPAFNASFLLDGDETLFNPVNDQLFNRSLGSSFSIACDNYTFDPDIRGREVLIDNVSVNPNKSYVNETVNIKIHVKEKDGGNIVDGKYNLTFNDELVELTFKNGISEYNHVVDKSSDKLNIVFKGCDSINGLSYSYKGAYKNVSVNWVLGSDVRIDDVRINFGGLGHIGDTRKVSFHVVTNDNESIKDGMYNVSFFNYNASLNFTDGWSEDYDYRVYCNQDSLPLTFKQNIINGDSQQEYKECSFNMLVNFTDLNQFDKVFVSENGSDEYFGDANHPVATVQRALELVKNDGVIRLLSNIVVPEKIVVDKDVRIGGHDPPQITFPGGDEPVVDPFNLSWNDTAEDDFHYLDGKLKTGILTIAPEHNVKIENIGFINANDENGSAIANYQSNLTVYKCNFVNNHATGLGAAILSIGDYDINNESKNKNHNKYKVDIAASFFTHNTAPQGSVITNLFSDLYMYKLTLYDNNSMSHNSSMIYGMAQVLNITDTLVLPSDEDLEDIKSNKIYPAIDLTTIHLNNNTATTTILGWVRPTKDDVENSYRKGSVNFSFADNYRLKDGKIPVKHLKDEYIDKVMEIPILFEIPADFSETRSQLSQNTLQRPTPRFPVFTGEAITVEAIRIMQDFARLELPNYWYSYEGNVPRTLTELQEDIFRTDFEKELRSKGGEFNHDSYAEANAAAAEAVAAAVAAATVVAAAAVGISSWAIGLGLTIVSGIAAFFGLWFGPRYNVDTNVDVVISDVDAKTYKIFSDDPVRGVVGDVLHMKFNVTRDGVDPVILGMADGSPVQDGEYSFVICEKDSDDSETQKISLKDGVGDLYYKIPYKFTKDLKIKFKGKEHDFKVNEVKYQYNDESILEPTDFISESVEVVIDEVNYTDSVGYIGDSRTIRFKVNDRIPNIPIKDGLYGVRIGDEDLSIVFKDGWGEYNFTVDKPRTNLNILFKNNYYADIIDDLSYTRRYNEVGKDLVVDWKKRSNLSIDNVTFNSSYKDGVYVGDSVNVSFHVVNSDMNNSSISDGRYNVSVGGSDLSLDFVDGWANYLYEVNQTTDNLSIVFKENLEANDTQSVYLSVRNVSDVNWIVRPFKTTQLNILNDGIVGLDADGGVNLRFNVSTIDGKSVRDGVYRVTVFYFVDSSSSSIPYYSSSSLSYFDVSFRDGVGECYYVPNVGVDVRLMITFERVLRIYSSSSDDVSLGVPSVLNFVNGYSFGGWGSKLFRKNMFL
ncbi:MAG: right-handed parallel beta-helix repeat-containing protein [Methanobrevibacter sp.]|jgi:hypothetical protein|nr:right-handed parallel beta-helix repeat-containing protein [Candidatus Methanovirga meridionalis]